MKKALKSSFLLSLCLSMSIQAVELPISDPCTQLPHNTYTSLSDAYALIKENPTLSAIVAAIFYIFCKKFYAKKPALKAEYDLVHKDCEDSSSEEQPIHISYNPDKKVTVINAPTWNNTLPYIFTLDYSPKKNWLILKQSVKCTPSLTILGEMVAQDTDGITGFENSIERQFQMVIVSLETGQTIAVLNNIISYEFNKDESEILVLTLKNKFSSHIGLTHKSYHYQLFDINKNKIVQTFNEALYVLFDESKNNIITTDKKNNSLILSKPEHFPWLKKLFYFPYSVQQSNNNNTDKNFVHYFFNALNRTYDTHINKEPYQGIIEYKPITINNSPYILLTQDTKKITLDRFMNFMKNILNSNDITIRKLLSVFQNTDLYTHLVDTKSGKAIASFENVIMITPHNNQKSLIIERNDNGKAIYESFNINKCTTKTIKYGDGINISSDKEISIRKTLPKQDSSSDIQKQLEDGYQQITNYMTTKKQKLEQRSAILASIVQAKAQELEQELIKTKNNIETTATDMKQTIKNHAQIAQQKLNKELIDAQSIQLKLQKKAEFSYKDIKQKTISQLEDTKKKTNDEVQHIAKTFTGLETAIKQEIEKAENTIENTKQLAENYLNNTHEEINNHFDNTKKSFLKFFEPHKKIQDLSYAEYIAKIFSEKNIINNAQPKDISEKLSSNEMPTFFWETLTSENLATVFTKTDNYKLLTVLTKNGLTDQEILQERFRSKNNLLLNPMLNNNIWSNPIESLYRNKDNSTLHPKIILINLSDKPSENQSRMQYYAPEEIQKLFLEYKTN